MDNSVRQVLLRMQTRPGATANEIDEVEKRLGIALPADYVELLRYTNGCEGFIGENYIMLYEASYVRDFGIRQFLPSLLYFASDGAGEGFAFVLDEVGMPIVNVPFLIEPRNRWRPVGTGIAQWFARLARGPLW